ncbi:MAG: glycoside hydrolase family 13 protein [Actinomycetaceae bacterium]|nr:glycoside hydrolase family 13 protein [Actinomycetaceae bacterium]
MLREPAPSGQWWADAVIYQIYPRSFASSAGPIGDIAAMTRRLDHLADLGVDAVWISPFYSSPQKDAGYDVADYRDIDPLFGSLADADALIARAHELSLKVIVDLVPNHTSDRHRWFAQALAAGPGSPERERYWFRPGRDGGPPNDWRSVFGSIAWTRVRDRDDAPGSPWQDDEHWYLHLFDSSQPDLNWANPEVREEFRDVLRFWLERGVDGFRVDVAHGLAKNAALPNWDLRVAMVEGDRFGLTGAPMWNLDAVHEIYREWRGVLDEFGSDRMLVAEAWVAPATELAKYVRRDEMSQAFNFEFLECGWQREGLRRVIASSLAAMDAVGAPTTWVLSNHDVVRAVSRLGLADPTSRPQGIAADDPQPDNELGYSRAMAMHMLMAGLPGSFYIWQGEELGLPEHTTLDHGLRQDPAFFRTGGEEIGRDGCRVPMPWSGQAPGLGFSPDGQSWLPIPESWRGLAADVQAARAGSTLSFFERMLRLRRELGLGRGGLVDESDAVGAGCACLAYRNTLPGRDDLMIVVAFDEPLELPRGWKVLLSTAQAGSERREVAAEREVLEGSAPATLAPNSAAWLVPA